MVRCRCVQASQCTVSMSAPASLKAWMYRSGCTIIKCVSKGFSDSWRTALTTGIPKEILGTNTPSMMSK